MAPAPPAASQSSSVVQPQELQLPSLIVDIERFSLPLQPPHTYTNGNSIREHKHTAPHPGSSFRSSSKRADVRAACSACFSFCRSIPFSPRPPPAACRRFSFHHSHNQSSHLRRSPSTTVILLNLSSNIPFSQGQSFALQSLVFTFLRPLFNFCRKHSSSTTRGLAQNAQKTSPNNAYYKHGENAGGEKRWVY